MISECARNVRKNSLAVFGLSDRLNDANRTAVFDFNMRILSRRCRRSFASDNDSGNRALFINMNGYFFGIHCDESYRNIVANVACIYAEQTAQNTYLAKSDGSLTRGNAFTRSPGTHHARPLDEQYGH